MLVQEYLKYFLCSHDVSLLTRCFDNLDKNNKWNLSFSEYHGMLNMILDKIGPRLRIWNCSDHVCIVEHFSWGAQVYVYLHQ